MIDKHQLSLCLRAENAALQTNLKASEPSQEPVPDVEVGRAYDARLSVVTLATAALPFLAG